MPTDTPYTGKKMNKQELLQAIRLDIIGEFDAIIQYQNHIMETDNELARKVWSDIRDEEKVHVGELMALLAVLDPQEAQLLNEGEQEVRELLDLM